MLSGAGVDPIFQASQGQFKALSSMWRHSQTKAKEDSEVNTAATTTTSTVTIISHHHHYHHRNTAVTPQ
jgi:hypothetical protein